MPDQIAIVSDFRAPGAPGDAASVEAALASLGSDGGIVYFPQGEYRLERAIQVAASRVTFRGAGMAAVRVMESGGASELFAVRGGQIAFEDIGFEAGLRSNILVVATGVEDLRITRCRFHVRRGNGMFAQDVVRLLVEDCDFFCADLRGMPVREENRDPYPYGNGLQIELGSELATVRGCSFRYLFNALIVSGDANHHLASRLMIERCTFDGGWYTRPSAKRPDSSGFFEGTPSAIEDALLRGAPGSFPSAIEEHTTVRLMIASLRGTATGAGRTRLSGANFDPALGAGEIIRCDGRFAVIEKADSSTTVRVEEWLDDETRRPVSPPRVGQPYTVYRVILGRVPVGSSNSDTQIHVERWHDLSGRMLTGAELTRFRDRGELTYEILPPHPNYLLEVTGGDNVTVAHNVFRRGWSDQCSVDAELALITGNRISDGQDMGITSKPGGGKVGDGRTIITDNVVRHNGGGGITVIGPNTLVARNVAAANVWQNPIDAYSGDINAWALGVLVDGNLCDGEDAPYARYGIVVSQSGVVVTHNRIRRHRTFGIRQGEGRGAAIKLYRFDNRAEGTTEPVRIWNNHFIEETEISGQGHVLHDGCVPGDYVLAGRGSPQHAVSAAPGSMYREIGTPNNDFKGRLWLKREGHDNVGWLPDGDRLAVEKYFVHGVAFVAERAGGWSTSPGPLTQVDSIPWTDVLGLPQGWGKTFRGGAGEWVWFHAPVPTPTQLASGRVHLEDVFVQFETQEGASLRALHVWDGPDKIAAFDGLDVRGNHLRTSEPGMNSFAPRVDGGVFHTPRFGLVLCVWIAFEREANVLFSSAGASFVVR